MSNGLRVWNESGMMTLDVTDRLTRLVHTQYCSFPIGVTSYSFLVPGFLDDGTWGYVVSRSICQLSIIGSQFTLLRYGGTQADIVVVTVFRF